MYGSWFDCARVDVHEAMHTAALCHGVLESLTFTLESTVGYFSSILL